MGGSCSVSISQSTDESSKDTFSLLTAERPWPLRRNPQLEELSTPTETSSSAPSRSLPTTSRNPRDSSSTTSRPVAHKLRHRSKFKQKFVAKGVITPLATKLLFDFRRSMHTRSFS